jgi:membrane protein
VSHAVNPWQESAGRHDRQGWVLIKDTVSGFIEHENLTRGAAIAYYTIFSIAPLLIIVIAIASLAFGHDAAEGAIGSAGFSRRGLHGRAQ